jgi:hypothetical protein
MNAAYYRKLACDELYDSIFFATGERPVKEKTQDFTIMKGGFLTMKVVHDRHIYVNGDLCKSVPEAKYVVADLVTNL